MQGLKNFWQRPEGTVGKVVLVLGGIARRMDSCGFFRS